MHSFQINPDHIMSEVYSYPYPEVRELIDGLRLPARFMLNTLPVAEAATIVDEAYGFEPQLEMPANKDGSLSLDELHVPVIARLRKIVSQHINGLEGFEHTYPTPGSSQALYTLMSEWHARGKFTSIAILNGEYEGYSAYADSMGIPVTRYDSFDGLEPKDGELWFVSNPSAVDGNWIDPATWQRFTEAGHQIVHDAAYVGLTEGGTVDVSAPNIRAVLTSPSKIFGVFRYRNTGVAYVREPVDAMYGTKWFKDIPALLDTLKLYEEYGRGELVRQYRPVQEDLCRALSRLAGVTVKPSDTLLLAHATEPLGEGFARYRRGAGHRFGLTKLYEDYETSTAGTD